MAAELGKIPKPSVGDYSTKRKLMLVPLIFAPPESPLDFIAKFNKYWEQVESHITNLESRLGSISKIFHELIPSGAEDGLKAIEKLNDASYQIVKTRLEKGATFETIEDMDLLTEFMDWSRCLIIGLQNPKVIVKVHEAYTESQRKRNENIFNKLNGTLGQADIGILFIQEGHQVQFPPDMEIFYVAPPALDEIKRWVRTQETEHRSKETTV